MTCVEHFHDEIPICPVELLQTRIPSLSLCFASLSILSLVFALLIFFQYNSVKISYKKVQTEGVCNTLWVFFFACLCLRGLFRSLEFAFADGSNLLALCQEDLHLSSLILHGCSVLVLSLALNHQRIFRSASTPPAFASYSWYDRPTKRVDLLLYFTFFLYTAILYLHTLNPKNHYLAFLFSCIYVAQRLPIVVLILMIVCEDDHGHGPMRFSKYLLIGGGLLSLGDALPIHIWMKILPGVCLMDAITWIDLLQVLFMSSLWSFFFFVRNEYLRNVEECIWTTISSIHDNFDFRKF